MARCKAWKVKRCLIAAIFLFYFLTTPVYPDGIDSQIAAFLEAIPSQDHISCAYTRTHSSKESGTRIERYSPEKEWRLLTIDGNEPSERETAEYLEEASERLHRRASPIDLEFLTTLLSNSVQVDHEDEQTIDFVFSPEMGGEMPEELEEKLSGRLTVSKAGLRPLNFVISLDESVSPMRAVKLRKFKQEASFGLDHRTGATLIKSMSFEVGGRAFLVTKIDQQEHVEFSDFDCQMLTELSPED